MNGLAIVAGRGNEEPRAWRHAGHKVMLERVAPFFGDPRVRRWAFWSEPRHTSLPALLSRPDD